MRRHGVGRDRIKNVWDQSPARNGQRTRRRDGDHLIELTGVIKWFDVSKGFGFIVPDNGMPDILLHVTCLRRDGFQTAYEGARVICEVLQRPKGLQAFRIVSMDE